MTISVQANGLTFSFPDGTTTAQIGEAIDGYFANNPPAEPQSDWVTGLKKGAWETARSVEHEAERMVPGLSWVRKAEEAVIPGFEKLDNAIEHKADTVAAPTTTAGKVAEALPSVGLSFFGWEPGVDALAETALPAIADKALARAPEWGKWVADKAMKGAAGTLGSDLFTGESPDNVAAGGLGNVVAETVFHTPQGLRLISALIQKNDAEILAAADHIGVTPTAAMTSAKPFMQRLEQHVSNMPGGGIVATAQEKVRAGLDAFAKQVRDKLGYKGDSTALGESIREALANYVNKFDTDTEAAYEKVMKNAGLHQRTNTRRFVRKVQELGGLTERAGLDKMTVPPIVRRYMDYIEQAGNVPQNSGYGNVVMSLTDARKALKILDDYIGTGENATADAAAAKQMASALREDIGGTFAALGLGEQWQAVQSNYARQLEIIARAEKTLLGANTGDEVYRRLFGNPWEGFKPVGRDTIAALKPVMGSDVMNSIAAEVVHRMGLEGAGAASGEGRAFSPALYLTNWNKLNDAGAVESLFSAAERNDIDALAKVSEGAKRLEKAKNHSNTASHMLLGGMLSSMFAHPVLGAASFAGTAAGYRLLGLALTHPETARFLTAAENEAARGNLAAGVKKLAVILMADPKIQQAMESLDSEN